MASSIPREEKGTRVSKEGDRKIYRERGREGGTPDEVLKWYIFSLIPSLPPSLLPSLLLSLPPSPLFLTLMLDSQHHEPQPFPPLQTVLLLPSSFETLFQTAREKEKGLSRLCGGCLCGRGRGRGT